VEAPFHEPAVDGGIPDRAELPPVPQWQDPFQNQNLSRGLQQRHEFRELLEMHPQMTKEYFEQHRRKQEKRSTASNTGGTPGRGGSACLIERSQLASIQRPDVEAAADQSVRPE